MRGPKQGDGAWRDLIPPEEWATYARAGYGGQAARGLRPALLIVDATYRFVGVQAPLEESQAIYAASAGKPAWDAVANARVVLRAARRAKRPVLFTVRDEDAQTRTRRMSKHSDHGVEPPDANNIVAMLAPRQDEAVLAKARPSPFHGTPLLSILVHRAVDTVVVVGGVTSGCVRATAVDAYSLGFRVIVVEDAVFDRSPLSHAVNLFDLEQKYSEIATSGAVARYLLALAVGSVAPGRRRT